MTTSWKIYQITGPAINDPRVDQARNIGGAHVTLSADLFQDGKYVLTTTSEDSLQLIEATVEATLRRFGL